MQRTKVIHLVTTDSYEEALVEAYEWVLEEGGTLIYDLPSRKDAAKKAIIKKRGRQQVADDLKTGRMSIGVAYGERYSLRGPRIAIFDGSDTDMERIEAHFQDEWDEEGYSEIRSFTKTVDTHEIWTRKFDPDVIDRT